MYILGINGGFSQLDYDFVPNLPNWFFHDSSAVIVKDARILSAHEEERLTRIKHTNKFPFESIKCCLNDVGVAITDIDFITFPFDEYFCNNELLSLYMQSNSNLRDSVKTLIINNIRKQFDYEFHPENIRFIKHHYAHAIAAYYQSGFSDCLCLVIDGQGERESMSLYNCTAGSITQIYSYDADKSIGKFYRNASTIIGYGLFDEYKVMGLAPYGNSERYMPIFKNIYELLPNGEYSLKCENIESILLETGILPRRKGDDLIQEHMDYAASIQAILETIVFHVLRYWQSKTCMKFLSASGGVIHNCRLNGQITRSGLFNDYFAHPIAHEPSAAMGAALAVSQELSWNSNFSNKLQSLYFGLDIDKNIEKYLNQWGKLIKYDYKENIPEFAANLIHKGEAIGWVQGKSEYGPRALGNRSILADPRPNENKDRINAMVKKREAYRPFAPAVMEEDANIYFELIHKKDYSEMIYVVPVKEQWQNILGAVTHIDGSARVQTVSKKKNDLFWNLLNEFKKLSGIGMLLNTSFNNNAEPIVETIDDAILTFLTTNIDCLIAGNFFIQKNCNPFDILRENDIQLQEYSHLLEVTTLNEIKHVIEFTHYYKNTRTISNEAQKIIKSKDSSKIIRYGVSDDVLAELYHLLQYRMIRIVK
jgi:predicted NodU family carbamoyl transferase